MVFPCKVLAAGFNAHGQLDSTLKPNNVYDFRPIEQSYVDPYRPHPIVKLSVWSATIFASKNGYVHRGMSGSTDSPVDLEQLPDHLTFFGDVSGWRGCFDGTNLRVLSTTLGIEARHLLPAVLPNRHASEIQHIAIAGNGQVCVVTLLHRKTLEESSHQAIGQREGFLIFPAIEALSAASAPLRSFPIDTQIKQLVATSTSFAALTSDDRVVTWGDPRYPSLLGRTPSADAPATHPSVMPALDGIKIAKIVSGSWVVAAKGTENDLYIWGHHLPQRFRPDYSSLGKLIGVVASGAGEREDVHLVDVANGADIEDVAVGDEHLVVQTADGVLWGFGSNEYGQLGLGKAVKSTNGKWVRIGVTTTDAERVIEMAAGPLNTFLVIYNQNQPRLSILD
ncbi:MAG: hypothetical protein Q9220_005028 [cf. Caloplaca sp. 1 TL-2023]